MGVDFKTDCQFSFDILLLGNMESSLKPIFSISILLICLILPASAFSDFDARETVLSNGLVFLALEDHYSSSVSMAIAFKTGMVNERKGSTGITRICRHIINQGTAAFGQGEYARTIQAGGGTAISYTQYDYTSFRSSFPSKLLDTVLTMEADRMQNISITYEKLLLAKEAVRKERQAQLEGSLFGPFNEELFNLHYRSHPYQNPFYGWADDINRITLDEVKEYFRKYFQPGNALMVIIGDIDTDKVVEKVKEKFSNIISRPVSPGPAIDEPERSVERRAVFTEPFEIPIFLAAYHVPSVNHPDFAAVRLLNHIAAGGGSSRLYKSLITDEAMAVAVGGDILLVEGPGMIFFWSVFSHDIDIAEGENALLRRIDNFKVEYVTEAELDKAKNKIEASYYRSMQSPEVLAARLLYYQLVKGDWRNINKSVPEAHAVTREDIKRVAEKYLNRSNMTAVVIDPSGNGDLEEASD
jgi:zinc protease